MVKNIEWTSCLEYPQQRTSSSIATLSFIGFKRQWKWLEEKLAWKSIRFFWLLFFFFFFFFCARNKSRKKSRCPRTLKKNTSDSIEPRVYELSTIQPEVRYFRTSNRISLGSLVSWPLVKGNEDSWYEAASIPETTNQSVPKNNFWVHRRFQSYLTLSACLPTSA